MLFESKIFNLIMHTFIIKVLFLSRFFLTKRIEITSFGMKIKYLFIKMKMKATHFLSSNLVSTRVVLLIRPRWTCNLNTWKTATNLFLHLLPFFF